MFNHSGYEVLQSKGQDCCPDVASSNIPDADSKLYNGEQIMTKKESDRKKKKRIISGEEETKKKRMKSDQVEMDEHFNIPDDIVSSSNKQIVRTRQPIKAEEIDSEEDTDNGEVVRIQQPVKTEEIGSDENEDKYEKVQILRDQQTMETEGNDLVEKKDKDKESDASSKSSHHLLQGKVDSPVQKSKTETSKEASSRKMLEEYEKGEAERKLETRRFLKRLTWKRGHLREKMQLSNLKSDQYNLKKKNTTKSKENKALQQLINKLKGRNTKDPVYPRIEAPKSKHEMSVLLQLSAMGRNGMSQGSSKDQTILQLQEQLRQQQRTSNQYESQLRGVSALKSNPNPLNPSLMYANQTSQFNDDFLKAHLLYQNQMNQNISGMQAYSTLSDSNINNPFCGLVPGMLPSIGHTMPLNIEAAQKKMENNEMLKKLIDHQGKATMSNIEDPLASLEMLKNSNGTINQRSLASLAHQMNSNSSKKSNKNDMLQAKLLSLSNAIDARNNSQVNENDLIRMQLQLMMQGKVAARNDLHTNGAIANNYASLGAQRESTDMSSNKDNLMNQLLMNQFLYAQKYDGKHNS